MTNSHPVKQQTFFSSQTLRWLAEPWETPNDLRPLLQPSAFRAERAGAAAVERSNVGDWQPLERDRLVDRLLADDADWHRVVFTTDAGIGKTTNLNWLHGQINARRSRQAALSLTMTDLAHLSVDGMLGKLLEQFRQVSANSTLHLPSHADASHDPGLRMFEHWRQRGLLTVIVDGLDQALPTQISLLRDLLRSDVWRTCRFVLGGRPSALQTHWDDLFAHADPPFQFVRLDDFDDDQQRRYLGRLVDGQWRRDVIPEEAHGILSVPRVLEYLRDHVKDTELPQIKTASDVYWRSTRHMVKVALANSSEARKIGLAAGAIPADKPTEGQISETMKLLAAVAYAMTSQLVTDTDEHSETHGQLIPNFSLIEPGSPFEDFREQVVRLMCNSEAPSFQDRALNNQWLDALGAANDAVASGFYDSDTIGLNGILWRNKTLQEFFTALWCAKYATPKQSHNLWDWLYLAGQVETEPYYWVNRFLAEMPKQGRHDQVWVNSLEPVYRPGDGTAGGTKRSTEMLFRSWRTMHALAGEPVFDWWDCSYEELIETETRLKQGEGPRPQSHPQVPRAREVLAAFHGEFQQILDGIHGKMLLPTQRQGRQAAAVEVTRNFVQVVGGTFRMGAPDEKQGMGIVRRRWWERQISQVIDPETIARQLILRSQFEDGPRGESRYEQFISGWTELIATRDVKLIESRNHTKNETPEHGEEVQHVADIKLSAFPVLNSCYRLFDPAHGSEQTWYSENYVRISPTSRHPVIYTSWWNAWAVAQWLCWKDDERITRCRLPHEPEFEFVAKQPDHWDWDYWWGDDIALSDSATCNCFNRTTGTRPPEFARPFRAFHDLLGNVWEWMANNYREKYSRRASPDNKSVRMLRGGSWKQDSTFCRSARRHWLAPGDRGDSVGCRLVCVAVPVKTS